MRDTRAEPVASDGNALRAAVIPSLHLKSQCRPLRFEIELRIIHFGHLDEFDVPLARAFERDARDAIVIATHTRQSHLTTIQFASCAHELIDERLPILQAQDLQRLPGFYRVRILARDDLNGITQRRLVTVAPLTACLKDRLDVLAVTPAKRGSISIEVRRGNRSRKMSVVIPGPGPTSNTSSPSPTSLSAQGMISSESAFFQKLVRQNQRWKRLIVLIPSMFVVSGKQFAQPCSIQVLHKLSAGGIAYKARGNTKEEEGSPYLRAPFVEVGRQRHCTTITPLNMFIPQAKASSPFSCGVISTNVVWPTGSFASTFSFGKTTVPAQFSASAR